MTKIYFEALIDQGDKILPKPSPSAYQMPDWWKNSEYYFNADKRNISAFRDFGTIKSCPAIQDSLCFGYNLLLPQDLYLNTCEKDIFWEYNNIDYDNDFLQEPFVHAIEKSYTKDYINLPGFIDQIIKITPYWGVRTEEGYSCIFTSPQQRNDLPIRIIDSIVDTDRYPARFPYGFQVRKNFDGIIKRGTPFIQVMPFFRENFESEIVSKLPTESDKIISKLISSNFSNAYKKMFWTRKKFF